jgi:hypothetical protein
MNTPRARRRWFQFSLRTLFLLVLLLSLPLSWFAARMERIRKHKQAIHAVHGLGGRVMLSELVIPPRIWQLLGAEQEYFAVGLYVGLNGTAVTDADLEHLEAVGNLQGLSLSDTEITDEGLKHLVGLTNLRHLDLLGTKVTPEGVERLQEALPECKIMY